MKAPRRLVSAAVLVAAAAVGSVGKVTMAPAAGASAAHRYTLRVDDRVTIPVLGQPCAVYTEGGVPELFCARLRHARHQVTIFNVIIEVWKVGHAGALSGQGSRSSQARVTLHVSARC